MGERLLRGKVREVMGWDKDTLKQKPGASRANEGPNSPLPSGRWVFSQPQDRRAPYTEWGLERTNGITPNIPPFPALSWAWWPGTSLGTVGGSCPGSAPSPLAGKARTRQTLGLLSHTWNNTVYITNPNTAPHTLTRKINSNPGPLTFMLFFKLWRTRQFLAPFCIKEYVGLCALSTVKKHSNISIYTSVTS